MFNNNDPADRLMRSGQRVAAISVHPTRQPALAITRPLRWDRQRINITARRAMRTPDARYIMDRFQWCRSIRESMIDVVDCSRLRCKLQ